LCQKHEYRSKYLCFNVILGLQNTYFDGVALLAFVVAVDKPAFNLVDNLSKDVRKHPQPDIRQRILNPITSFIFFKFSSLLSLVEVGKHKEYQS